MSRIQLISKNNQHYYCKDKNQYPSVTTILSLLNKPALINWAVNATTDSIRNDFVVKKSKIPFTTSNITLSLEKAKRHHRALSKDAANMGSEVHSMIEKHFKGKDIPQKTNFREPIQKAFGAFQDWLNDFEVEAINSEIPFISAQWGGYGGTIDLVAEINGKNYIVDFKTSNAIYDDYVIQIAAYRTAYVKVFGALIERMAILRLDKRSGKYEWREYNNSQYMRNHRMFGHLCRFWHLKNSKWN